MNMLLNEKNWETSLENISPSEITDVLLKDIEDNVKKVFKLKQETAKTDHVTPETEKEGGEKQNTEKVNPSVKMSNNRIPRKIRKLWNQKRGSTKSIFKSTSAKRCLDLRNKIDKIEEELKSYYKERRSEKEKEAISKMRKKTQSAFIHMLKDLQKLSLEWDLWSVTLENL